MVSRLPSYHWPEPRVLGGGGGEQAGKVELILPMGWVSQINMGRHVESCSRERMDTREQKSKSAEVLNDIINKRLLESYFWISTSMR